GALSPLSRNTKRRALPWERGSHGQAPAGSSHDPPRPTHPTTLRVLRGAAAKEGAGRAHHSP
ncbi:hypothetical protein P7K49_020611, partial [Saguinus oedipus]